MGPLERLLGTSWKLLGGPLEPPGAYWGPLRAPQTSQDVPKGAQDAPRRPKDAPSGVQEALRGAQEAPRGAQKLPRCTQDALWKHPRWLQERFGAEKACTLEMLIFPIEFFDFSRSQRGLGGSLGRFRASGWPSWTILEAFWASWGHLGDQGCVLGAFWVVLGASWGVRRSANQRGAGATRARRGRDAGADGVPVPPGAATIKEYQYTRHQDWITRHAVGQRPGELKKNRK